MPTKGKPQYLDLHLTPAQAAQMLRATKNRAAVELNRIRWSRIPKDQRSRQADSMNKGRTAEELSERGRKARAVALANMAARKKRGEPQRRTLSPVSMERPKLNRKNAKPEAA